MADVSVDPHDPMLRALPIEERRKVLMTDPGFRGLASAEQDKVLASTGVQPPLVDESGNLQYPPQTAAALEQAQQAETSSSPLGMAWEALKGFGSMFNPMPAVRSVLEPPPGFPNLAVVAPGGNAIPNMLYSQFQQAKQAVQEARRANPSGAFGHGAAAILPVVGPFAANIGEKLPENPGRAVGQLAALAVPGAPRMLELGERLAPRATAAVKAGTRAAAPGLAGATAAGATGLGMSELLPSGDIGMIPRLLLTYPAVHLAGQALKKGFEAAREAYSPVGRSSGGSLSIPTARLPRPLTPEEAALEAGRSIFTPGGVRVKTVTAPEEFAGRSSGGSLSVPTVPAARTGATVTSTQFEPPPGIRPEDWATMTPQQQATLSAAIAGRGGKAVLGRSPAPAVTAAEPRSSGGTLSVPTTELAPPPTGRPSMAPGDPRLIHSETVHGLAQEKTQAMSKRFDAMGLTPEQVEAMPDSQLLNHIREEGQNQVSLGKRKKGYDLPGPNAGTPLSSQRTLPQIRRDIVEQLKRDRAGLQPPPTD